MRALTTLLELGIRGCCVCMASTPTFIPPAPAHLEEPKAQALVDEEIEAEELKRARGTGGRKVLFGRAEHLD